uniref:Ninjurin 1 n=1 Tax=Hucho hucho TaxID=62062 RepID=A0A4W5NNF5_9TELE
MQLIQIVEDWVSHPPFHSARYPRAHFPPPSRQVGSTFFNVKQNLHLVLFFNPDIAINMEMNGSADRENGGEVPHTGVWHGSSRSALLNMNHYANKKSAAESMLDVALLMANASQLKAVLEQGPDFYLYTPLITLISISLSLQVTVGVLLIFIVRWNLNDQSKHFRLNVMENLATGLVFIIVVVNVFITAFGVQKPNQKA